MSEASYALVFQGNILAGFERAHVMQRFGELFGLTAADVERIFDHPRVVLKRNLSQQAALAYLNRLADIGMAVSLDTQRAAASGTEPASMAAAPADAADAPPAAAPLATPAPVAEAATGRRDLPFEFHGRGGEFFRIWIVNILLTILTLGIYSAWAKVRTQRYFYGNARLDGASFEYLADPLKIFKGRMIAFGLLLVYMLADRFVPLLGFALMLAFLGIFPWVVVRGLSFRNHNSAYRGVRFAFAGELREAYKVFLLWPLLGLVSFGLLFPYAVFRQQRYIIGNTRYGAQSFAFGAGAANFYWVFVAVIGTSFAGGLVLALTGWVLPLATPLVMVAFYLALFALFNVMMTNLRFNNTTLGEHALRADYGVGSYAMLMLTNTLAVVLTMGLFYPWAKVRNARYAAGHIGLVAEGELDAFAAAQREEVSALGGEIGDVFDVDMGI